MSELRSWRFALVLGIVVVLVYGNSLNGSFHYDDFHSLVDNPHIRSLTNVPGFFAYPGLFSSDADKAMYRPLLLVSYALNYALGEYRVAGYHVVNIILHLVCCLLVWGVAGRSGCRRRGAQWAACLFALHPLATEPVNYISSRSELLGACFYLASFLLLGMAGGRAAVGGGVCFVLGLLSKEMVITLPFMVWLQGTWGERQSSPSRSDHRWLWLLSGGYMAWQIWNRFLPTSLSHPPRALPEQLWTQVKAMVLYTKLILVPIGLNVEHQFSESVSLLDGTVVVSAIMLVSLVALSWLRISGDSRFWLSWAFICLLPATVVPLNVLVNEHRLYLPLAGLAILVGKLWPHGVGRGLVVRLWPAALLLLCAHTISRNAVWENELSLWGDAAIKSPSMARPHVHLGNAQAAGGDRSAAEASFKRALQVESTHRAARTNLASLYLEHALTLPLEHARRPGFVQAAQVEFERVLRADPKYREALSGKATALSQLGQQGAAIEVYEQLLSAHPHFADGYYNMGLLLYEAASFGAAAEAFERAARLQPGDGEVFNELGNAYTGAKEFSKAAHSYRTAHQLSPNDVMYARNLVRSQV